jgi:5'-3' exonuclease
MGIPYYFVSLIRKHKGILSAVNTKLHPDVFAIDFNCFIHTYLDDTNPIQSILNALKELFDNTCSGKKHTYIAMDGLVPYAKIVQQRYRRFKIPEKTSIFDRNQISPETPFMKDLSKHVKTMFPNVIMSDTSEPGEGEHKLLNWMSTIKQGDRRSVMVYGLDADLILLCLMKKDLSLPYSFNLLRETNNSVAEGFSTLSIWKLNERLEMPIDEYIRLSVMCFGNDFMPTLGMFSLREGGHERAVQYYKQCGVLLDTAEGRHTFLTYAAKRETDFLMDAIKKRNKSVERCIVPLDGRFIEERYKLHILDGVENMKSVVEAYWKTYHWTYEYFTTNTVKDWGWVYPYADSPLVSQIIQYNEPEIVPLKKPVKLSVTQQLQFILPAVSLKKAKKRVVFEDEFYDEETEMRIPWLKRYTWESKPRISLPWNPSLKETEIESLEF